MVATSSTSNGTMEAIAKHVDRQLIIPLLQHLREVQAADQKALLLQLLEIVNGTGRVDLAQTVARDLKALNVKSVDLSSVQMRHKEITETIKRLDEHASKMQSAIKAAEPNNDHSVKMSEADVLRVHDRSHNANLVARGLGVSPEELEKLYEFGKLHYEIGKFEQAADMLECYKRVSINPQLHLASAWGTLAAHIMANDLGAALEDVSTLRDVIESTTLPSPSHTLQQRTWLLHWALFVMFRAENGIERLVDLFFSQSMLNAIESSCPWLIRYVVAAAVLVGKKNLRDAARYANQERYRLNDPLCSLLEHLHYAVDLEAASTALKQLEKDIQIDYFLQPHAGELVAGLRRETVRVIGQVYMQIPLGRLENLLGVSNSFNLNSIAPEGQSLQIVDGVVTFSQGAQSRRSFMEKIDKLSHRSDNALATFYKKY